MRIIISLITHVWLCTCAIISSPFSRQLSPILKQRAAADRSSVYLRGEVSDSHRLELCSNRVCAQGNSAHLLLCFFPPQVTDVKSEVLHQRFLCPRNLSLSHWPIGWGWKGESWTLEICGYQLIRTIDLNGRGHVRDTQLVKFEIQSQKREDACRWVKLFALACFIKGVQRCLFLSVTWGRVCDVELSCFF